STPDWLANSARKSASAGEATRSPRRAGAVGMERTASMRGGSRWRGDARVRPAPEPVGGDPNPHARRPRSNSLEAGGARRLHRRRRAASLLVADQLRTLLA